MIRIFRHYVPKSLIIVGTSEAVLLFLSVYVGVTIRVLDVNPTEKLLVGDIWTKALFYTLLQLVFLAAMGLYERGLREDLRGILFRLGVAFLLGLLCYTAILSLFPALSIGSGAFTVAFVCSAGGVVIFRTLVHQLTDHSLFRRRVLVFGAGDMAAQVQGLRRKTDHRDMMLVGYVRAPGEEVRVRHPRIFEAQSSLLDLARKLDAQEIVVAVGERRNNFPSSDILDCKMHGIEVIDLVKFFEQQTGKIQLEGLNPSSLIFADGFIQAMVKGSLHRGFDLLVSAFGLLITSPVFLATAAAIFVESGFQGSVFYRQVRVGRDGKHFEVMKFRSMREDAEREGQAQWARPNDPRITRVGAVIRKTRIDELPQLINVLKGEMSFVGPRPERPEFVRELAAEIPYYELRHRVNPGITGWAQIRYPYGASSSDAREKLQYDLYYIKNYSLFLDLMILIQTAQVILWGKGAR